MKEILKEYISQTMLNRRNAVFVGEEENLLGDGLIDSVGMMSLILFIEERFNLQIPPEDVTIEHFLSINTIDAYLKNRKES